MWEENERKLNEINFLPKTQITVLFTKKNNNKVNFFHLTKKRTMEITVKFIDYGNEISVNNCLVVDVLVLKCQLVV